MTTHWTWSSGAARSCESDCSATLTIVVSSTDMIAPRITTTAIRLTWRGMTTGSGAAAAEEVAFMRTGRFFR